MKPSPRVKLSLNDYVRGRFGHERAVGTTMIRVPSRWTFVRFARPSPPRKALYSLPDADGCGLRGQLAVVSVSPTSRSPKVVARQDVAAHDVLASGTLQHGAWAIVRYGWKPTRQHALLSANTVLTVARHRVLLTQARVYATCDPGPAGLRTAVKDLQIAAKSILARVRIEHRA